MRKKGLILLANLKMVPTTGLEPVRCYSLEPESSASANSATWATGVFRHLHKTRHAEFDRVLVFVLELPRESHCKRGEAR